LRTIDLINAKTLIDFLSTYREVISQYPLEFIIMGIVTGFFGFFGGTNFLKNQNDSLKSQIESLKTLSELEKVKMEHLREEELKKKEEEIKTLTAEVEKIKGEKQKTFPMFGQPNYEYEKHLTQLSILELSKEAEKMAKKLERSIQVFQQTSCSSIDTGLYNEWISEGGNLLAIKHESLKRLPKEVRHEIDQVSDSRYTLPAFQADSIIDAVNEIKNIGLKLFEHNTLLTKPAREDDRII
jgi:hypothetical protein